MSLLPVLAISSWYLLKGRDLAFARRSFAIASAFGLAAALSVIVLGDESGYALGDVQKVKLAAIEAEWETHPAPAAFTLFGFPNQETRSTDYAVRIPAIMGLIATRSTDQRVDGLTVFSSTTCSASSASGGLSVDDPDPRRGGDEQVRLALGVATTSATGCCSASTRGCTTPAMRRLPLRWMPPFPEYGRCSGRSASWLPAAS